MFGLNSNLNLEGIIKKSSESLHYESLYLKEEEKPKEHRIHAIYRGLN